MIISAHQANLFHYSGVLERIRKSDIFIALGHVQFTRGNYHNRFQLDGKWYTISVNQKLEPLVNKRYSAPQDHWRGIKRKLPQYAEILTEFDDCIGEPLVETNVAILRRVCEKLGIKTKIVLDYPTELTASARLADLCAHYGAKTYLSGPSGLAYLNCSVFNDYGVHVSFQEQTKPRAALELLAEARRPVYRNVPMKVFGPVVEFGDLRGVKEKP